jgi:hypothetical protein
MGVQQSPGRVDLPVDPSRVRRAILRVEEPQRFEPDEARRPESIGYRIER